MFPRLSPPSKGTKSSHTGAPLLLLVLLSVAVVAALPLSAIPSAHADSLGAWVATTSAPTPSISTSCTTYESYIYCVGNSISYNYNDSYWAALSSSGIGSWSTDTYPVDSGNGGIADVGCAIASGYMYCVGGETQGSGGHALNAAYYATVSNSGFGTWTATTSYPTAVAGEPCVISGGYIYCVDGASSYYAPVSSSGIGAWTQTTSSSPADLEGESCATSSGYIYCVAGYGTSFGNYTSAVSFAPLSPSGIGAWTSTTNYPIAVSYPSCTISAGSYIFCVGGTISSSEVSDAVYYAPVTSSGVGGWTSGPDYPVVVSNMGCVTSGNYIYCAHDADPDAGTDYALILASAATSSLTVTSQATNGAALTGFYSTLSQNGNAIATGFTPSTFTLNDSQTYQVSVSGYGGCAFDHWLQTGSTDDPTTVSISGNTTLTAVLDCASQLKVDSESTNGTALTGFSAQLSQSGSSVATGLTPATFTLNNGEDYAVTVGDYGHYAFSYWLDTGSNDSTRTVSIDQNTTVTAVYAPVQDPTQTSVSCELTARPSGTLTCTATVTDTASDPLTPTGTVAFAGSGALGATSAGSCSLSSDSTSVASCSVEFTPTAVGAFTVTASYEGDYLHLPSSGDKSFTCVGLACL